MIFLVVTIVANAQDGRIIYNDLIPDSVVNIVYGDGQNGVSWTFDLDQDGTDDIRYDVYNDRTSHAYDVNIDVINREGYELFPLVSFGTPISQISDSGWLKYRYSYFHWMSSTPYDEPNEYSYFAIRKKVDGGYQYGWIRHAVRMDEPDNFRLIVVVDKMAFCTITDYPLLVGQAEISLNDMVAADPASSKLQLLFQPGNAMLGVGCTQSPIQNIEVFDCLGRRRFVERNINSYETTLNLRFLSAGVYILRVVTEEGSVLTSKFISR